MIDWSRFTQNKYLSWYQALVSNAVDRELQKPYEKHHVLPRSLGGDKGPLVKLTYREHFLAHWLLTKFTAGVDRTKMVRALGCMTCSRNGRCLTSWQYQKARKAAHESHKGKQYALGVKRSAETRAKMSIANRIRSPEARAKLSYFGRNRSAETREKLRLLATNLSPETRAKRSAAAKGRKWSDEQRAKLSERMKGHKRCVGRVLSEETKAKIGAASRNRSPEANARIGQKMRERYAKIKMLEIAA